MRNDAKLHKGESTFWSSLSMMEEMSSDSSSGDSTIALNVSSHRSGIRFEGAASTNSMKSQSWECQSGETDDSTSRMTMV